MKPALVIFLGCILSTAAFGQTRASANYGITTETHESGGQAVSANYKIDIGIGASGGGTSVVNSPPQRLHAGYIGQLSDLLTLAISRKTHGGAGTFDINLPLSGLAGIECRSGSIYNVVFTFANTLTSVASVTATATGPIQPGPSSGQIDPMDAHNYIANLTAVPNAQYITVTLSNVNDSDGNVSASVPAVMGLLIGDANANRAVNASDVSQTKSRIGQAVDATNFRSDVNANGALNAGDVANVKANIGTALP